MLKPKLISQVLQQATTGGVKATILLNPEGSLLAFAAQSDRDARIYAAIASNIWTIYSKHCKADVGGLSFLMLECEEGKVAITVVSTMILCLVARDDVELGILKAKSEALTRHLEEPLSKVAGY
ncbi:Ragulator complex protein lamtor2 [Podila minutissima]|uniref:Ragulator complex protein lamtor2 n=1 Tax=Podila minutissima TaxID=64525 RepID=A0A9P5SMR9_9FUNG|nr:Ragulator complex protein lamtor2 [Podila minutissima]